MDEKKLINLTIDGSQISVPKGTTVYEAAKKLGIEIPIFCYSDRMPPFGACRMCLVEVEKAPKLQASCTLEAAEGMVVKTNSQSAVEGRQGIVELLLINHPLDCPICDRGGECPLQENALQHGPGLSRFFEEKRHFKKPLPLSPVLMLDRERCIICARCTRFGELIAGDNALEFVERGYKTEVGTPDDKDADSKFIGNTIMICPVGALTSNVYRFRARPWDNEPANSTCTLCPIGCSLILDSRDGEIMRVRSRENKAVNDIWLCDKGWFGYEHISHPERLLRPYVRKLGSLQPSTWEEALTRVAQKFQQAKQDGKIAGLGGNPLTVEENYLFQKLIRELGGANNLDYRIGMPVLSLAEEGMQAGMQIALEECEGLSFAALIGIDLTEEFPLIWLRLKQAMNKGATAWFIGHYGPEMARHLAKVRLHTPGKELEELRKFLSEIAALAQNGKPCALFVGKQYLNMPFRNQILFELQAFCRTHPSFSLNILEGQGNSLGARFAGMRPDLGPAGMPLQSSGMNSRALLESAAASGWDFLYVVGCNLARKLPSALWKKVREQLGCLVVQDLFMTETAQQADVVLPVLSFTEKGGSFINIEGRVQKLRPGKEIPDNLYSDGEIFMQLAEKLGSQLAPDAAFLDRLHENRRVSLNQKDTLVMQSKNSGFLPVASQTSLKASFAPALFDNGVRMKHNPHLIQMAKEPNVRMHPQEAKNRGIEQGNLVRLSANGNEIEAKVTLDDTVAAGTIVIPLGFDAIPAHDLGINLFNGMEIEIEKTHN